MEKTWPVQDVKARLSEVLREAEKGPQIITYRGEPKFEVRLIKKGRGKGPARPMTLADLLLAAPKVDLKLPPRRREKPRKVF
jgi:antitoxin (DNA-binding transcriptional repressor) of toxin-antitoxin stability system